MDFNDSFITKTERYKYGWIIIAIFFSISLPKANSQFQKNYYSDAHYALHRLVREKTHPHLKDFEIVMPKILHGFSRRKRDLPESDYPPTRISLSSQDHDFDIEIIPTEEQLIGKDFFVHRISHSTEQVAQLSEQRIPVHRLSCHHIGRILSHGNRTAAISTCGGMTGLLRTEHDDFLIEPVPSHLPHGFTESHHPHILYKRRHLHRGNEEVRICGKSRPKPIRISRANNSEIREFSSGKIVLVDGQKVHTASSKLNTGWRSKRSEPTRRRERQNKVVETLVVVDERLVAKHAWMVHNVTQYILTVMNMAAALYKDPALDVEIDIAISGIIMLDDDQGFQLDHRADVSLGNFCVWQSKLNLTGIRKPDHAVLITGTDICINKNEPCDTLGLAQIGGMCSRTGSCTINEDTGLGVAFTIAHEMGHSFGLQHDGQGNSCSKRDGHIMSSTLNTDTGVFSWSSCSRRAMNKFLQSRQSQCLGDRPSLYNISCPEELPGQVFNASKQCQLQYGALSDVCFEKYIYDWAPICKILFCYLEYDGACKTKHMPAAEGTSCGVRKWCRRGVCVPLHSSGPKPVDGGWTKFRPWSECSQSCGRGVSYKERSCTRPKPRFGGRYCEGEERLYRICNPQNCPPGTPSYRAQQCAKYNSHPYRKQYFSWIPFTRYWKYDYNHCELFCEAEGHDFFDRLSSQVLDGTPCDDDTNDVCIEGHCEHVGCDLKINSDATEDACGVCNGDNSTCVYTNGSFRRPVFTSGYFYVTNIPKGARTIRIWQEDCCTHTYIAARNSTNSSHYHLNGGWRVNLYGNVRFAGTTWMYERKTMEGEALYTVGPLKEEITIEVLIVRRNPGILFTYAMPQIRSTDSQDDSAEPRHTYSWTDTFTACSQSCGEGVRHATAKCIEDKERFVQDGLCENSTKPTNRTVVCNLKPCPARWILGIWSHCSRSCGGGIQMRRISCVRRVGKITSVVSIKQCKSTRPKKQRKCVNDECPAEWKATRWTKCSKLCGRGFRSRRVYCRSGVHKLLDSRCNFTSKPRTKETCMLKYCRTRYRWSVGRWRKCSVACGTGKQHRSIKCTTKDMRTRRLRPVHIRLCKNIAKPRVSLYKRCMQQVCKSSTATQRPTTSQDPATPMVDNRRRIRTQANGPRIVQKAIAIKRASWVTGSWQTCTKSCGSGRQVRAVRCMLLGRPSVSCPYAGKPPNIRLCNTGSCPASSTRSGVCEDRRSWCRNVLRHRTCGHTYLARECCQSCRGVKGIRQPHVHF